MVTQTRYNAAVDASTPDIKSSLEPAIRRAENKFGLDRRTATAAIGTATFLQGVSLMCAAGGFTDEQMDRIATAFRDELRTVIAEGVDEDALQDAGDKG